MARSTITRSTHGQAPRLLDDLAKFFHGLLRDLADPYRPELHYMRGPGPRWHAKHAGGSQELRMMPALVRVRVKR
jgi:hypothetical protein